MMVPQKCWYSSLSFKSNKVSKWVVVVSRKRLWHNAMSQFSEKSVNGIPFIL